MRKFKQFTEVHVGEIRYTSNNIDIDFLYDFDDDADNNVSEISLWNINRDRIGDLKKGTEVILSAGYENDVGVVLIGKVGDFETIYHGVDKELKLYISDGLDLWGTKITKTYKNISAREVILDILSEARITVGNIRIENNVFYDKLVVDDSIEYILTKVAEDTGSKFYIKNSRGYFVDTAYSDRDIVYLDKDSGLVGYPERISIDDDIGWKITCLLEHRISVNSRIRVESKTAQGDFIVVRGTHSSDFLTEMEVLPV